MRRIARIASAFVATLGFAAAPALAFEQLEPTEPPGDVELINGAEPVSPADWPATLIFRSNGGGCTSTAVGSKVVLTAGHCVLDGETGRVRLGGQNVTVRCDHHPEYVDGNRTADFALCLVTQGEFAGVPFEVVGTSLAHPRRNETVILSGYGCLENNGVDKSFGVLHVGTAAVVKRPLADNLDTVVFGGAAVCFGDSGGAAYFEDRDGVRFVIGVNSRGNISTTSWLSSTATIQFVDWAVDWAARNQVTICGLNVEARGCRN